MLDSGCDLAVDVVAEVNSNHCGVVLLLLALWLLGFGCGTGMDNATRR